MNQSYGSFELEQAMRNSRTDALSIVATGDEDYRSWLKRLKSQVRSAQVKAAVRVNNELLQLYWSMGHDIAEKHLDAAYGSGFFDRLSRDLKAEFPHMEGFSVSNLKYIKRFYLFYAPWILQQAVTKFNDQEILQQPVAKLEDGQNRHQAGDEFGNRQKVADEFGNRQQAVDELRGGKILHQAVAKLEDGEILQKPSAKLEEDQIHQQFADKFKMLFSIPWWHHIEIFTHAKSVEEGLFYISKTLENGWSRNVLANMMEADLYHTQGAAITNFAEKLPAPESDLAQQTLKDPYCFDFIALRKQYTERELEDALMENITRFLLELGNGFSFIGRQYRLEVGGEEFFIDLLFYHLNLRRYIVVELKAGEFKPTDAGQLGFYVQAVNEQLKHPGDNDAIGLIICRQKNRLVAEYALKSSTQLLGISEYRLTKLLPRDFKSSLPSIQDIESQFSAAEAHGNLNRPQVEAHAVDITDHPTSNRTSKPANRTSNRTCKPANRTSRPANRTSNRTSKPTSNVQVEAQIHSKDPQGDSTTKPHVGSSSRPQGDSTIGPQVDSSSRPHVETEKEVRTTKVTDHRTSSEQVKYETVQVSKQVKRLITSMSNKWQSASDLRMIINIIHRPTFVKNYLEPALELGLIEMTQPDSPRSPTQKYRLTAKGKALARKLKREEGKK